MLDAQSTFKAIADPTRRAIIGMLADKEMTIGEVTGQFNMSRPAIAKHLVSCGTAVWFLFGKAGGNDS
ncbi:MAG: winged helix-turn-helix transcriptional regulator [Kordiimonadaceae bacterium]|nr:winged helix-turn-helix transcriptional regulator [Kordiimonadaceae bacterium]